MENEALKTLIEKYKSGRATDYEKALFEDWYLKHHEGELADYTANQLLEDVNAIWMELEAEYAQPKIRRLWRRNLSAAAAVILITIGIGTYIYTSSPITYNPQHTTQQDIAPGKNRATLTLANGKTILLSDGKTGVIVNASTLTYTDGSKIDGHDLQLASVPRLFQTPKGGQYQITLPDGTKVWLNAASSLTISSTFAALAPSKKRIVKLSGEAYFEVAKDKNHPFVVQSEGQEVEVLGTHFNVNSYADESTVKTTLLEGSVKIASSRTSETRRDLAPVILKPNEQAINTSGKINIQPIDTEEAIAWKNGEFMFINEALDGIMRKVSRWYDVDVHYADQEIAKEKFWGTISRFENISEVLEMLEMTKQVHFKIEGRRITVTK